MPRSSAQIWIEAIRDVEVISPNRFQVSGTKPTIRIRRDWTTTNASTYLLIRKRTRAISLRPEFPTRVLITFGIGQSFKDIELYPDRLFSEPLQTDGTVSVSLLKGAGTYTFKRKGKTLDLVYPASLRTIELKTNSPMEQIETTKRKGGRPKTTVAKSGSTVAKSTAATDSTLETLIAQVGAMQTTIESLLRHIIGDNTESLSEDKTVVGVEPKTITAKTGQTEKLTSAAGTTSISGIKIPPKPKCGVAYQMVAVELEPTLQWVCPSSHSPVPMPTGTGQPMPTMPTGSGQPMPNPTIPTWSMMPWRLASLDTLWVNATSTASRKYIPVQYRIVGDRLELRGSLTGGAIQPGNTNRTTVAFRLPAGTVGAGYDGHTLIGNANGHTANENDEVIRLIGEVQSDGSIQFYFEGNGVNAKEIITFDVSLSLSPSVPITTSPAVSITA